MNRACLAIAVLCGGAIAVEPARSGAPRTLEYAPAPVDNPLKGLVPYQGDKRGMFPHSLEFNYVPYSALVKGYDEFDWGPMEALLDDVAGREHQAIVRVFLEYPGMRGVIPDFLIEDGLELHRYSNPNADGQPVETPDYENPDLRRSLRNFIAAFGRKYDGDPRLGFLTAGLLGTWGEWHTFPRANLFASRAVQIEVMDAYEAAFRVTPVLLRYPAGGAGDREANNSDRPFGYHDDSFAWSTLDTGPPWFFMSRLKAAGPDAESKWKTRPIGGEIRPEAWGLVFDARPGRKEIQDFRDCVAATHVTWLMDSGMFRAAASADRIERAEAEVRRMGYEFHVPAVTIGELPDGGLSVRLQVENRGVAPFYYDWKPEWGFLADGRAVTTVPANGSLVGLLPGDPPRTWTDTLDVRGMKGGSYTLAVRVPNPLKTGKPLRFANTTQDAVAAGWLSLGDVRLSPR